ncbi:MAG: Rieske Fe-S protein [Thermoplasmatales archaeon A-plasma]|jgi:Rieske Fe-S protein|nr:MAG: Rieske Fe-S protein [Thermoplasmatales archaeon A-plasma]
MDEERVDNGKRNFLKAMIVISAGAAVAGVVKGLVSNIIPPTTGLTAFPTLTLVDSDTGLPIHTSDIKVNSTKAYVYYYPLQNDPNFLIRLGDQHNNDVRVVSKPVKVPATGRVFTSAAGVGPYGSVISSSAICQHLGCIPPIIHYYTPGTPIPGHPTLITAQQNAQNGMLTGYVHCNCHGSTYDPYNGFAVVTGPTVHPLPNTILEYESVSDTYKVKSMVGPTIYGKPNDLSGGTAFPSGTTTTPVNKISVVS